MPAAATRVEMPVHEDPSQRDERERAATTEALAHALLRLVADRPGTSGKLRVARIVGGYPVPAHGPQEAEVLLDYAVEHDLALADITNLVEALISGGLVAQTVGARPTLVLTRSGHRALDALEAVA